MATRYFLLYILNLYDVPAFREYNVNQIWSAVHSLTMRINIALQNVRTVVQRGPGETGYNNSDSRQVLMINKDSLSLKQRIIFFYIELDLIKIALINLLK